MTIAMEIRNTKTALHDVYLHLPPIPAEILNITYDVECLEDVDLSSLDNVLLPLASSNLTYLPICNSRILASGDDVKTAIELSIKNEGNSLQFQPGDTFAILPQNSDEDVDFLMQALNLTDVSHKQYVLSLKDVEGKKKPSIPSHIPVKGSLRNVFKRFVDVRSILKKVFICVLSKYSDDPLEKRYLEEISSREGSNIYREIILENEFSILDILKLCPSCKPPVTILLQHLPRLMPRPYSLCNSSFCDPGIMKFCFSIAISKAGKKGVATSWLEDKARKKLTTTKSQVTECRKNISDNKIEVINSKLKNLEIRSNLNGNNECIDDNLLIPFYLRKSNSFHLPTDLTKPIIMIGVGTGVAPFIGFLEDRFHKKCLDQNLELGCSYLYFGCRYFEKDFIYKDEIYKYLNAGTLTKLKLSHSREETYKEKYVQDNILLDAHELVNIITNKEAIIYVCGDINKINKDILGAITQIFVKVNGISLAEAEEVISDLKKNERYIQDIWS